MNTNMKDKIKMSIAIAVLSIIIGIVFIIVLQYQIEGEKNMPYKLSKITVISTAEGVQNQENTEETAKWNLKINQNNDIYFFIDENGEYAKNKIIDSVTIKNIQVTKSPAKGTVKAIMPSSTEGRTFTEDESYIIEDSRARKHVRRVLQKSAWETTHSRLMRTAIRKCASTPSASSKKAAGCVKHKQMNREDA